MVAAQCIRRAALMGAAIRRGIHQNQTARQEEAMVADQCICRIQPWKQEEAIMAAAICDIHT